MTGALRPGLTIARAEPAPGDSPALLIPRVFHRIWLGPEMPDDYVRWGRTWEALNPGWRLVTWTERELVDLRHQPLFDAAPSYAQKADIARYEVLLRHGGVYVDCDFECLQPIEPLLQGVEAFSATEDGRTVSIGIMGAVPGHDLFDDVIAAIPRSLAEHPGAPANVQTGPELLTRTLAERAARGAAPVTVFPSELFYPYSWQERHRAGETFPGAVAVHHWGAFLVKDSSWHAAGGLLPEAPPRDPTRFVVPLPTDLCSPAGVALAAYLTLFDPDDAVELALVCPGTPGEADVAALVQLATRVAPELERVAPLVLYSPVEVAGLDVAGVLAAPHGTAHAAVEAAELVRDMAGVADGLRRPSRPSRPQQRRSDGAAEARRAVFTDYYMSNFWGDAESLSGHGSNSVQTAALVEQLPDLFARHRVRAVLDAPCGDLAWLQELLPGLEQYIGVDIVPELVDRTRARYAGPGRAFLCADIVRDPLPAADLVLCRDALVHLPFADALQALANVAASGSRLLAATTFPGRDNVDVVTGGWRPLDLTRPPFCLPQPLELLDEHCTENGGTYRDKHVGLWRLADVAAALGRGLAG